MTANAGNLSMAERVDRACDQFEADWRSGQRPLIEDVMRVASEEERPKLLQSLLMVELELRAEGGESPLLDDYRRRFPNQLAAVESAFARAAQESKPAQAGAAATLSLRTPAVDTSRIGTSSPQIDIGTLPEALGRFQILKVLGEGAFGTVCKAHDPQLDREVAIKVPRAGALSSNVERERFLREARAAAGLSHPNICRVHEVGEVAGRDYIVMELVTGKPLSEFIARGKVQPRQAAIVVRKLALALEEPHAKGIVHRDLKPANVMINNRGEPIIMDFGLARLERRPGDAQLTQSGVIMGSPAYMSPEQARGATADIYSLGVILYELLCGRRPFEGTVTEVIGQILHVDPQPPSVVREGVDPKLEAICMRAMARQAADRYPSMRTFAEALGGWLKGASVGDSLADSSSAVRVEPSAKPTSPAAEPKARPPFWGLLTTVALGGLIAAGVVFFLQTPDGVVRVQIDDPKIQVVIDKDNRMTFRGADKPHEITLQPGLHGLTITRDDLTFGTANFELKRRGATTLKVEFLPGSVKVSQDGKLLDILSPPTAVAVSSPASPKPVQDDYQRISAGTWKPFYRNEGDLASVLQLAGEVGKNATLNDGALMITPEVSKPVVLLALEQSRNVAVRGRFQNTQPGFSLPLRYGGSPDWHYGVGSNGFGQIILHQIGKSPADLRNSRINLRRDEFFELLVFIEGPRLAAYVNGTQVFAYDQAEGTGSSFGLWASTPEGAQTRVVVKDLEYQILPVPEASK